MGNGFLKGRPSLDWLLELQLKALTRSTFSIDTAKVKVLGPEEREVEVHEA